MKFFPIRKLLLISLSSPFFYSISYAETVSAGSVSNAASSTTASLTATTSVNQLPMIVVKATDDATENTGKYKKNDSSQATKMDLALKETPQSVTVVTQQRMQDQGLNTIADVLHQVPGVSIGYNDSERPNYNIRGFGVDNIQIDGISSSYTGISGSVLALPVFDTAIYDHVEVLKGVNGLNTGLGEPSASINMIHKRPTQEFKAAASVSYDTFDGRRYTGDISGGLLENDRLNARLIASFSEGGTGKDYYDKDSKLISGSITSKLTDQTALTLGIDYQDDNPKGLGGGVPVFYSDGSKAHFSSEDNFGAMNWVQWHRQLQNTYIYLDHQFNENWKAKVAFSRQDLDAFAKTSYAYNGNLNKDGSGLVYSHWADEGELSQNTFDVTVNGLFSLFNREHQVVFGFNGWDRDTKTYGLTYPAYSTNNTIPDIRDFYGDASPDFNPQRTGVNTETHTKQNGVFLNTRWSIMDGLRVFTGGRLSDWKTDTQQQTGIFIPYVAATYDLTADSTIYTSYTEIFKPQTNRDINDQFLDPVTGSNIEVGIKNSFFDQNLDVNLAAFYTKKDNVAEQVEGTGVNGIDAKYRAVKGASTKGVELEALGQLTEKLNLSFGYGYNQTEDAAGETINTANPKQTAKLHLNYKMDDILAGLRVGGGVNWYGSSYDYLNMGTRAAPNLIKAEQEDYFVANLFGSYEINPQASVSLNINNLFDKQYYTRIISSYKTGYMGDGRSAAVTLRFKY